MYGLRCVKGSRAQLLERCGVFCISQKTADEVRISDWSSDVCSSDLPCREDLLARRVFQLYGVDTRTDDADRPLLRPGGLDAADRRILCDSFDPARNAQTESPRTVEFIGGDPRHGFERPPVAAPVAIRLAIEELGDGERLAGQSERFDTAREGLPRAQRTGAAARPGSRNPEAFGDRKSTRLNSSH